MAIRLMQKAIFAKTASSRQALLGCIFITCFEMLIGNRHFAIKHAQSGTMMLQQWRRQTTCEGMQSPLLSPLPLTIENEIVEAIQNLDIHVTALGDDRSAACHEEMTNDHRITSARFPASFENIREAQVYLNYVVRRISHLVSMASSLPGSTALSKEFDAKYREGTSNTTNKNVYSTSFQVSDSIRTRQAQLTTEISSWMRAFSPLFERSCAKGEEDEARFNCAYNAAAMMQMQAIATTILNAGIVMTKEMHYDKFNPQFRELVDLTSVVVKLRQQRKKDYA